MVLNGDQSSQWLTLTHLWTETLLLDLEPAAAALLFQPGNEADRTLPLQVSPPRCDQEVLRPHSPDTPHRCWNPAAGKKKEVRGPALRKTCSAGYERQPGPATMLLYSTNKTLLRLAEPGAQQLRKESNNRQG